jgi:hypothetical protein
MPADGTMAAHFPTDTSAVPSQEQLSPSVAEISRPKKGLGAAARLLPDAPRLECLPKAPAKRAHPFDRADKKTRQWQVTRLEWYIDCIR